MGLSILEKLGGELLFKGTQAKAPKARSYWDELSSTLGTQRALMGDIYGAEAEYQPLYADLRANLFNRYVQGITPGITEANRAERGALYEDWQRYNPEGMAGYDQLQTAANEDLAAGRQVAPQDVYRATSPVRSDWARRGLGTSGAAQLDESVALAMSGEDLYNRRFGRAMNAQQLASERNRLLAGTGGQAAGYGAASYGEFDPLFNPESEYAGNMYSQRYQTKAAIAAGNAANVAGIHSAGLGMAGDIIGSMV